MRVAMLSYHTCPLATLGGKDTGGMNVYIKELTRELGAQGIHVDIYTRSQDEHAPHVSHDLGYGNRVVHIPAGPQIPLSKPELVSHIPKFSARVLEIAKQKQWRYDLIHAHYWMSGIVAADLKSRWGIPVIQMFHTLGQMKQRVARAPHEIEGDYRTQGEQQVLKMADQIVAATPAEMAQLQWLYHADTSKITIIPPGVDTCHFYPIPADEAKDYLKFPQDARILLFVGRIEPLKGIDTFLRAVSAMRRQGVFDRHCCIRIPIIGGAPDAPPEKMNAEMHRLQKLCKQEGLDDLVVFLGQRGQDILPYYYAAADVVVMPSHYESFGMVALEAMACGTPVIATQVGGLAFLVQDGVTGFHIPVDDSQALSSRLISLLDTQPLLQRMSTQAAEIARNYAWEKITRKITQLYMQVLTRQEMP
ncbi:MAG TPA: glycosyltransferase family 1 protein [Anaerolineales bacterium]|nr:glycosyltransferase family 1 protein [Anaerolineales bacterium]